MIKAFPSLTESGKRLPVLQPHPIPGLPKVLFLLKRRRQHKRKKKTQKKEQKKVNTLLAVFTRQSSLLSHRERGSLWLACA
jgi:hypothetical protein